MGTINRRDFIALGAGGLAALGAGQAAPRKDEGLVVHEWGVVTIIDGAPDGGVRSAGVRLGKGGEEIADLPKFVTTWAGAVGAQIDELNSRPARKPIVYFYSKKEMKVRFKVSVPSGRPDAWWPPADDFGPKAKVSSPKEFGRGIPQRLDEIESRDGFVNWQSVTIDPAGGAFEKAGGWWDVARRTDAAAVRAARGAEKFLFYDAMVRFEPGLSILWKKGGKVEIRNASPESWRHLFAIRVKGGRCVSAYRAELAKGDTAELAVVEGKPENLADTLVAAGLYRKEADGLAEIWKEEFLGIDGARVLAHFSREACERLLPLEIAPEPAELKRVLIAHVECVDAERREEILVVIEQLGSDDPQKRDAAAAKLRAQMPLATSVIREALRQAKDAEVRGRLEDLLKPRKR